MCARHDALPPPGKQLAEPTAHGAVRLVALVLSWLRRGSCPPSRSSPPAPAASSHEPGELTYDRKRGKWLVSNGKTVLAEYESSELRMALVRATGCSIGPFFFWRQTYPGAGSR